MCVCSDLWSVIRWSLSGPSLTLRSPANESPACLSSALAPWGLFDFEDNKDSCCLQPGMMSRQRLVACQRSAALCAHCCNPHGSAGGTTLVVLCFTDSDNRKRLRWPGYAAKQGDPHNTRCYLHEDGSCYTYFPISHPHN